MYRIYSNKTKLRALVINIFLIFTNFFINKLTSFSIKIIYNQSYKSAESHPKPVTIDPVRAKTLFKCFIIFEPESFQTHFLNLFKCFIKVQTYLDRSSLNSDRPSLSEPPSLDRAVQNCSPILKILISFLHAVISL